jgi:hypothetical protein
MAVIESRYQKAKKLVFDQSVSPSLSDIKIESFSQKGIRSRRDLIKQDVQSAIGNPSVRSRDERAEFRNHPKERRG